MSFSNFKRLIGGSVLGLLVIMGVAGISAAQDNYRDRNNNSNQRYRFRYSSRNYDTDDRGAEMMRQAVREGYRQGFQAGQADRSQRRNNWRRNNIYREGSMGYDPYVDRSFYQHYFQQGFQKGYDDGYRSRNRYGNNGTILDSFLNGILRIRIN